VIGVGNREQRRKMKNSEEKWKKREQTKGKKA
jgi:hypothetical protein